MVSGLFHRARAITKGESKEEEGHLTQYCRRIDISVKWSGLHHNQDHKGTRGAATPHPLHPHVSGLSEDLRGVCRKYSIRTIFRTQSTLRRELSRIKDRDSVLKASGVLYEILCGCGQNYIGETQRALETCLKEHQAATRRGETEKSAIAEHAWSRNHQPLWEEPRILDCASHTTTLMIKEAIHISLRDPAELLNRDQGLDINCCWKNLDHRKGSRTENRAGRKNLGLGDVFLLTCVDMLTI